MRTLGVFQNIYHSSDITIGQALLISVFGFAVVFLILGFLAAFVYFLGRAMASINKKQTARARTAPEEQKEAGVPLPENRSQGELTLTGVSDKEAAVIMAVTSFKSKIPLNHLKFNSIKLLEDEENEIHSET